MPICQLNKDGYCDRHKKTHVGRELELSQIDTDDAEEYRKYWDEKVIHGPGWIRKGINFIKAGVQHMAAGLPIVSDEVYNERLSICDKCDDYIDKSNERWECKICGCFLKDGLTSGKARWAEQGCPIKKWEPFVAPRKRGGCCGG